MMYNPFSLGGKTILVTGASSGIGRAAAIECSKMGATIVTTGRNEERLNEVFTRLEGDNHQKMICNLLNEDELSLLVDNAPILNGLIVNAGINKLVPIKIIKRSDFDSILQTNVVSSILLLQKLLKAKKIAKGASVVFTSSMSALGETATGNAMYSASKGAITSFVRVAALELAPRGIRVNAVCPGEVKTSMNLANVLESNSTDDGVERYPLGRFGKPEDIALAMVYLLSDASEWVTGTNMVIDGGMAIR